MPKSFQGGSGWSTLRIFKTQKHTEPAIRFARCGVRDAGVLDGSEFKRSLSSVGQADW